MTLNFFLINKKYFVFKNNTWGWLRAVAALSEDQGLLTSIYMVAHNHL